MQPRGALRVLREEGQGRHMSLRSQCRPKQGRWEEGTRYGSAQEARGADCDTGRGREACLTSAAFAASCSRAISQGDARGNAREKPSGCQPNGLYGCEPLVVHPGGHSGYSRAAGSGAGSPRLPGGFIATEHWVSGPRQRIQRGGGIRVRSRLRSDWTLVPPGRRLVRVAASTGLRLPGGSLLPSPLHDSTYVVRWSSPFFPSLTPSQQLSIPRTFREG
jgi:hypothetical protein